MNYLLKLKKKKNIHAPPMLVCQLCTAYGWRRLRAAVLAANQSWLRTITARCAPPLLHGPYIRCGGYARTITARLAPPLPANPNAWFFTKQNQILFHRRSHQTPMHKILNKDFHHCRVYLHFYAAAAGRYCIVHTSLYDFLLCKIRFCWRISTQPRMSIYRK